MLISRKFVTHATNRQPKVNPPVGTGRQAQKSKILQKLPTFLYPAPVITTEATHSPSQVLNLSRPKPPKPAPIHHIRVAY